MKVVYKNIEMIAYFEEDGRIKPMRFRIKEDEGLKVIKVDKIIKMDIEKLCGNKMWVYTCSSIINNMEKIFEIKYDIENCRWILFKM